MSKAPQDFKTEEEILDKILSERALTKSIALYAMKLYGEQFKREQSSVSSPSGQYWRCNKTLGPYFTEGMDYKELWCDEDDLMLKNNQEHAHKVTNHNEAWRKHFTRVESSVSSLTDESVNLIEAFKNGNRISVWNEVKSDYKNIKRDWLEFHLGYTKELSTASAIWVCGNGQGESFKVGDTAINKSDIKYGHNESEVKTIDSFYLNSKGELCAKYKTPNGFDYAEDLRKPWTFKTFDGVTVSYKKQIVYGVLKKVTDPGIRVEAAGIVEREIFDTNSGVHLYHWFALEANANEYSRLNKPAFSLQQKIDAQREAFEAGRLTHPMVGFKYDTFEDFLTALTSSTTNE